jgi:Tfp pilus tip-associated adhesin PilY1
VTLCGVPVTTTDASGVTTTKTTATRVVLFGTGRLLDVPDTTNTDVQSLFALKDSGTALGTIRPPPGAADPERARLDQQLGDLCGHQQPGRPVRRMAGTSTGA